jgi:hypothetical protein
MQAGQRPAEQDSGQKASTSPLGTGKWPSLEEPSLWYKQERLTPRFYTRFHEFERPASYLREQADIFSRISTLTLEKKRYVIAGSDAEFAKMQRSLSSMQGTIIMMVPWNRPPFEQTLAKCQKVFAQLSARFASFKQEISDQEAREQEPFLAALVSSRMNSVPA